MASRCAFNWTEGNINIFVHVRCVSLYVYRFTHSHTHTHTTNHNIQKTCPCRKGNIRILCRDRMGDIGRPEMKPKRGERSVLCYFCHVVCCPVAITIIKSNTNDGPNWLLYLSVFYAPLSTYDRNAPRREMGVKLREPAIRSQRLFLLTRQIEKWLVLSG